MGRATGAEFARSADALAWNLPGTEERVDGRVCRGPKLLSFFSLNPS